MCPANSEFTALRNELRGHPIREAAFANLKAPLPPVRAPIDPTDASEEPELRAGDELPCTIVVKPPLTRLETCDYRMTRSGVMFRCMLIW